MKVVLRAFGKLESKPMDWPDNSPMSIYMMLDQPPVNVYSRDFSVIDEIPRIKKRGRFDHVDTIPTEEGVAEVYQLVEIQ